MCTEPPPEALDDVSPTEVQQIDLSGAVAVEALSAVRCAGHTGDRVPAHFAVPDFTPALDVPQTAGVVPAASEGAADTRRVVDVRGFFLVDEAENFLASPYVSQAYRQLRFGGPRERLVADGERAMAVGGEDQVDDVLHDVPETADLAPAFDVPHPESPSLKRPTSTRLPPEEKASAPTSPPRSTRKERTSGISLPKRRPSMPKTAYLLAGRDFPGSRAPLSVLHGFGDVLEALVGVGEEHHGPVLVVEELVVHAGEAGA